MHDGDKDASLDCSLLLYLGSTLLPLLLDQVFSVPPREAKSGTVEIPRLPPLVSRGNASSLAHSFVAFVVVTMISSFMCLSAEERGLQVHRVLSHMEAAAGKVRAETRPSFRGGLRVVSDGHLAGQLLRGGRPRTDPVQEVIPVVLLGRWCGLGRRHQVGGRCGVAGHRV